MTGVFRKYVDHKFNKRSEELIFTANEVIREHQEDLGLTVDLRQIHYRIVDLDPEYMNTQGQYKGLGKLLSKGREAGLVSWTAMEDRGRGLRGIGYQAHPHDVFKGLDSGYTRDKWADQDWRPEVWVEKRAQSGVVGQVCNELQVNYFASNGYNSATEMWKAGRRLARYYAKGQTPIVFYTGDYDPSGLDMIRHNQEKLSLYAGVQIIVQPLALNRAQVDEYQLPPNPLKMGESRNARYRDLHGDESFELDALPARALQKVISDAVLKIRDDDKWAASVAKEVEDKRYIADLVQQLGIGIQPEEDREDDNA